MELYYNPEQMSDSEIKQTFVGRQWLVDELTALIGRQPKGAGLQHVLLIGSRGMGKTTLLLMLRFAVLESDLGHHWQPVRFPEESYGINDLADFWLAALSNLSHEVRQPALLEAIDKLKAEYKNAADLSGAAHAALKDWSRKAKRRVILLVDNLDMILDQIGSSEDNAALRNVLMNDGTVMLVGTATSFFKEARNYDQALYNFFHPYSLDSLGSEQVQALLRQRASVEGVENFESRLRENQTRIKVLHYFTGGNPRLILMLYRIIVSSDFLEVRKALEKLLDEVTPYYKAKIEVLPPQQRKILDCIARISGQTGEGLTPTEIARETRLTVNQTSSQLKRLSVLGYVRAADVRGRSSYYSLAEPLYAIWHQMRFGREGRLRMEWLVAFLKEWYSSRELVAETDRLAKAFTDLFASGDTLRALETVEARKHLLPAMDLMFQSGATDRLICDCLSSGDLAQVREVLRDSNPAFLLESTRIQLRDCGILTNAEYESLSDKATEAKLLQPLAEMINSARWADLLPFLETKRGFFHAFPFLLKCRALAHMLTGDFQLALQDGAELVRRGLEDDNVRELRAGSLMYLGRLEEAAEAAKTMPAGRMREIIEKPDPSAVFRAALASHWTTSAAAIWSRFIGNNQIRPHLIAYAILAAQPSNTAFLRSLINNGPSYPEFSLLHAVLDYVDTGDRSSIAKLSSETRGIAEELLAARETRKPD